MICSTDTVETHHPAETTNPPSRERQQRKNKGSMTIVAENATKDDIRVFEFIVDDFDPN